MAHLVLHVGAHKTGTSYLQRILFRNRALLAEHDVAYPDLGPNPAHHILAAPWIDMPEIDPHWYGAGGPEGLWSRFLKDMAARSGTVILSAEPFSRMAPQAVDMSDLAARCRAFESVTVVYVTRDQIELAQSIWLQRAKTTGAPPVDRFVDHAVDTGLASGISLDHMEVYERLLAGFAPQDIRVADYHQLRRAPDGLLGGFLQLAGVDLPLARFAPLPATEANISPDPWATLLATRLCQPRAPDIETVAWINARLQQRYAGLKRSIFTRQDMSRLAEKFAVSNRSLEAAVRRQNVAFATTPAQTADWMTRDDLTWEVWADLARSAYHAA